MVRPTEHPWLEEGTINDQLPPALEEVEKADFASRSLEFVSLFDGHPWHAPPFRGQGIASACVGLFLHEHLLMCSLPSLRRHDRRRVYSDITAFGHLFSPFGSDTNLNNLL